MSDQSEQSVENEKPEEQSHESIYLDWNNAFEIIDSAFEKGLFVIIIGPKGTGKTTLVREYAMRKSKNLQSINFSLRTRESHLVGTKSLTDGNIGFDEGILVKSMKEGNILYANTLRQASAVEELYYSPSIRETIAFAKLIDGGVSAKQAAKTVFGNVYSQWGNVEFQKVNDIITSMFGS